VDCEAVNSVDGFSDEDVEKTLPLSFGCEKEGLTSGTDV
jgi:hypothetical protein